ncbi:MAG: SulP family inorganic anion transporter [Acidiferrobacterales bacterium]|nr:SulP family inorganic anion transporter [Acidiferrobacterales bacterium]
MPKSVNTESAGTIQSLKIIPALSAGSTAGLSILVAHIAFAGAIFSGPLQPYLPQGVGLVLFGVFVGCISVALTGSFRGAIAGISPALVIVMAQVGLTIDASGEVLFVTTVVALTLGSVVAGTMCLLIGRLRLSMLVRFIPFSVAAGFVGGMGIAVGIATVSIAGVELDPQNYTHLFEPSSLVLWLPGAMYGLVLFFAMRRWKNALILPFSVVVLVGAYHLVFVALGLSIEDARDSKLLLNSVEGVLWPVITPTDLAKVDWNAVIDQIPNLLVLIFVALVCVVMSLAGLETLVGRELNWDREFSAAGISSIFSGVSGATFTYMVVPPTYRSWLFGASTRLTSVICALVIGGGLFFGSGVLEFLPVSLLSGLLFFVAIGLLDEGLYQSYKKMPATDYAIVLLIVVVINVFGFVEGIVAGLLATLVFFALRLSLVDPIADEFTGRTYRSKKVRQPPERTILLQSGDQICGYSLRGYLFFGSARPLVARLRKPLNNSAPPTCLILDMKLVSGVDYSAVSILGQFIQNSTENGVQVVICAMSDALHKGLMRDVPTSAFEKLWFESSKDQALERCEDLVIENWESDAETADLKREFLLTQSEELLERYLDRMTSFEDVVESLSAWLETREYKQDEKIAAVEGEGIHLLASGRATVFDQNGTRVRQCGVGDVILPVLDADTRAHSVVAELPCKVWLLGTQELRWIEQQEKSLALKLYRYLYTSCVILDSPD